MLDISERVGGDLPNVGGGVGEFGRKRGNSTGITYFPERMGRSLAYLLGNVVQGMRQLLNGKRRPYIGERADGLTPFGFAHRSPHLPEGQKRGEGTSRPAGKLIEHI